MWTGIKKLFGWNEPVQEVEEPDEQEQLAEFFSTHALPNELERARILEKPFAVTPENFKVVDDNGQQIAMDSNAESAKSAFVLGQANIPDGLLAWFVRQSFIGYQTCSLIAQHWLVDRACTMKGRDAVRNGFELLVDEGLGITPKQLKHIEKLNKRFKLKQNLEQADKFKNVFGIRHVLFDIEGIDYEKPFNPDGIKPGAYKGISQIDPYWITQELTGKSVSDAADRNFYEPEYWVVQGRRIHRSHFVILRGPEVGDVLKPSYQYGGIPLTQRIYERVYAAERTCNESPQLMMTKRLYVQNIDIGKAVQNQAKFEQQQAMAIRMMDNYAKQFIGKDEQLQKLETALADVDAVIMTQYQIAASIAEVPATELLKTTPKGFNATGEFEMKSYHGTLETIQECDMSPIVERHLQCLMRSHIAPKFNTNPFYVDFEWNPISVMTEEQKATMSPMSESTILPKGPVQMLVQLDSYDVRDTYD